MLHSGKLLLSMRSGKWVRGARVSAERREFYPMYRVSAAAGLMLQPFFCSIMEGFGSKNILSTLRRTIRAAIWLMVSPRPF